MSSVAEEIAKSDAEVAAVQHLIVEDPARDRVLEAASRHNARIDSPELDKKGLWSTKASGVRIDDNAGRHPWSVIGRGETAAEATDDLLAKLDERVTQTAPELCPLCKQPLPADMIGPTKRIDAPD